MAAYLGAWLLWGVTAIPVAVFSLFVFREPPMWPHFSEQATVEGTIVWLLFVLWIYALPVGLLATRRRWLEEKR
jgi:hypothetical protein